MSTLTITKGLQIPIGNFTLSVGTYNTTEIGLFSNHNGMAVRFSSLKRSKKLRTIKRKFGAHLSSHDSFFFSHVTEEILNGMMLILKK
tara:strand:+ start:355 stop:618 length:264 start_codon:yes stop_codon:yes gene_type:complete